MHSEAGHHSGFQTGRGLDLAPFLSQTMQPRSHGLLPRPRRRAFGAFLEMLRLLRIFAVPKFLTIHAKHLTAFNPVAGRAWRPACNFSNNKARARCRRE